MKFAKVILLASVLALGAGVGCKGKPKAVTDLGPGARRPGGDAQTGQPILPTDGTRLPPGTGLGERGLGTEGTTLGARPEAGAAEDTQALAAQVIYFDFDKSTVKPGERSKLEAVAAYLKNNPAVTLKVEGHCDERGTEEYNRALGERRAIAARDFLVQVQGIDSSRITTVSFGEDKPADEGKSEEAYGKNRRDEFVVLKTQ